MKNFTFIITALLIASTVWGQELEKDMFKTFGENNDRCYGNALMPTVYDTITEKVEIKAAYTYIKRIPPVYDTIVEKIMVRPGYTKYELTEPVFGYDTIKIEIHPNETFIEPKAVSEPRVFVDKMEIRPEMSIWSKTKRIRNCRSSDPERCLTWRVVKTPAEFVSIRKELPATDLKQGNEVRQEGLQYKTVVKKVIKKEGQLLEIDVFPEYEEVTRYIKKENARFEEVNIKPEYQEVQRVRVISEGGKVEPIEVLCNKDYPQYIQQIQEKLAALGYDPGPVDGVLGRKTKNAITQYQADNNLPIGQLDFQTLKSLGIVQ
jgi:hypothetical protein